MRITTEIRIDGKGVSRADVDMIAKRNGGVQKHAVFLRRPAEAIPEDIIGLGVRAQKGAHGEVTRIRRGGARKLPENNLRLLNDRTAPSSEYLNQVREFVAQRDRVRRLDRAIRPRR